MKDATSLALITGASRGIGYQTALELASQNITVIATARSTDRLEELASHSPHITPVPADLTKSEDLKKLVDFITEQDGQLHYLIHNAGALINKPFTDLTDQDWQQMWQVNLMAAVQLTRSVLEIFSDGAHILNISSMGGYQGSAKFPGLSAYSVAKGGLAILTECLAAELADQNIKSNCLCLGAVQTEMLQEAFPGMEAPVTATEMGTYVANFAINGSKFYNGKILPVALHDPS
jgi:NAD(P)-dependent dehydrogenase (short-subunit alcohol dehydrogenase family)